MNGGGEIPRGPGAPVEFQAAQFPAPVFPGQQPYPPGMPGTPPGGGPTTSKIIVGAIIAIVVLLIGGTVAAVAASGGDKSDKTVSAEGNSAAGSAPTTAVGPCTTAPTARLSSYRRVGAEAVATVDLSTTCDGGDTITSDGVDILLAQTSSTIAGARFNFSSAPIPLIKGRPTQIELRYGPNDFWTLPESVILTQATVTLSDTGTSSTTSPDPSSLSTPLVPFAPVAAALPPGTTADSLAYTGLRSTQAADSSSVQTDVADRWVPQLSSKQVGLVAEGKTWQNTDILQAQFDYRARFPESRLLWSGDWSSFSVTDWWITVVAVPFSNAAGANAWCDSQRLAIDQCFAKKVTNRSGPEQTTVYRR